MLNKEKKVTIIVPIYNIEKYLKRCIESIINQSYANIEIILVNDGSTDNSKKIIGEFSDMDKRIKIINKTNGGLSSARNAGLGISSGDYIMFVDGDDWIDKNCVEKCLDNIEEDTDAVLFPYIREYVGKSIKNEIYVNYKMHFKDEEVKEKILKRLFGINGEDLKRPDRLEDISTAWGKMYKANLIEDEKFTDTQIIGTEDLWFNVNVFLKAKYVVFTKDTYYHYYKENEASLTKKYNPYLFERWKILYKYMERFIYENKLGNDSILLLNNRKIINLLALNRNIINSNLRFIDKKNYINDILKNDIYIEPFKNFQFSKMNIKWRVFYKACYYNKIYLVYFITKCAEKLKKIIG
ncbi:glycosyltransferase family 2 protein [Clostridium butyricum]|uniref:glycosyltransferase family 2 protein n=1 Tax=Clostridium butyricum TaxID=1492 RepID=UPI00374ED37F